MSRYKEKRVPAIKMMAIASFFVSLGSLYFFYAYITGYLSTFNFLDLLPEANQRVEYFIFIPIILLNLINFVMFEFLYLIFQITSKKTRNRIYIIESGTLIFACFFYVIFYLFALSTQNEYFWYIIFIESIILFFRVIILLTILFFVVLNKGFKMLKIIDKKDKGYRKVKYLILWCIFGGIFFLLLIFIFTFHIYGIFLGISLFFALASSYCVYSAYIKQ